MTHSVPTDLTFHKSSYSQPTGNCVEVAEAPAGAAVRDTQHRELGHLTFPGTEWTALLRGLHARS